MWYIRLVLFYPSKRNKPTNSPKYFDLPLINERAQH